MMSQHEIYETARRRIDQRTRRWTLWAMNLAGLIFSLAGLILLGGTVLAELAVAVFLAWGGIFTMHTIVAGFAEARDGEIEKEVSRLRELVQARDYEKPKRLEITDDGELADVEDWDTEQIAHSQHA
jgi:hypothetical protein